MLIRGRTSGRRRRRQPRRLKRILLAAAAAIGVSAAAFAEGPEGQTFDLLEGEKASTIVFDSEGGYTLTSGEDTVTGTFTYAEGELCVTPAAEGAETLCGAWTDLEIGESATSTEWTEDGAELVITRVS